MKYYDPDYQSLVEKKRRLESLQQNDRRSLKLIRGSYARHKIMDAIGRRRQKLAEVEEALAKFKA